MMGSFEITANEGDEVEIGKPLAVVGSPGEEAPEIDVTSDEGAPVDDNQADQNEETTLSPEEPDAQSTFRELII